MSLPLVKRVFKRYSESFKQKVVNEIESGALMIHQAQKRYQIGSHGTIKLAQTAGQNGLIRPTGAH